MTVDIDTAARVLLHLLVTRERTTSAAGDMRLVVLARELLAAIETRSEQLRGER